MHISLITNILGLFVGRNVLIIWSARVTFAIVFEGIKRLDTFFSFGRPFGKNWIARSVVIVSSFKYYINNMYLHICPN